MKPEHKILPVEPGNKVLLAISAALHERPDAHRTTCVYRAVLKATPPYEVTDEEVGTALTAYFEVIKALEGAPLQAGKSAAAMRHALEDFVRERK